MPTPEELERLRNASQSSAQKARQLLDEEVKCIMDRVARIDELKPITTDDETFKKLINIVTEANNRNESIATVKENVSKLGGSAVATFKEMAEKARLIT
jgi:3-methyladenine DNA glycosylase/8-oxoguanine DNA glycosylase